MNELMVNSDGEIKKIQDELIEFKTSYDDPNN